MALVEVILGGYGSTFLKPSLLRDIINDHGHFQGHDHNDNLSTSSSSMILLPAFPCLCEHIDQGLIGKFDRRG